MGMYRVYFTVLSQTPQNYVVEADSEEEAEAAAMKQLLNDTFLVDTAGRVADMHVVSLDGTLPPGKP